MTPFLSDWEKNGAFVSALLGVHDIVSESVDRRAVFFAAERIHKPVDRLHRVILHVGIANAFTLLPFMLESAQWTLSVSGS